MAQMITVTDPSNIRTMFRSPLSIDLSSLFSVREVSTSRSIPYRAVRDNEGRYSLTISDENRGKNIRVVLLWSKVVIRQENESSQSYLSRLLFQLKTFTDGLDTEALFNFTVLNYGDYKIHNTGRANYNVSSENFDLFGTELFDFYHLTLFKNASQTVNSKDTKELSFSAGLPVVYTYYYNGVRASRFSFNRNPIRKYDRTLIQGVLNMSSFLFNVSDMNGLTLRYR